jgi:Protein of unknown function (DUF2281)
MLTTIRGVYDKGQVHLNEKAPVNDKTDVIITFLIDDKADKQPVKLRIPGGLKGKGSIPDDFDEPLEDLKDYM